MSPDENCTSDDENNVATTIKRCTDGVTLIEKRYTKETYQAVCYGIPQFTIVCEYGRCNPQQDFEQVAATPDGEQSHDSEAVN